MYYPGQLSKFDLFIMLASPDGGKAVTIKGVTGFLSAIEREDGSGSSFNVTLLTFKGAVQVHVRTVD